MKLKRKLLALGLVGTMVFGVGCSASQESSSSSSITTMNIAAGGDAVNLNPLYANDRVSLTVMNALYNPLYVVDKKGEKTFYLAEDVKVSDDFLTYTVKLKSGLKWHDKEALTADDLIFTMESILDKKQASINRGKFVIEDTPVQVKKIDDTTVEFKLPAVSTSFETMLGNIRIIPKHIYEGEKDLAKSDKNNSPVGNGAYKFKEYKTGELITLERFDDYYGEKGNLQTITYRVIADSNSANMALQNGEINAKYVQPDEISDIEGKDNIELMEFDEGMVDNIIFMQNVNDTLKDSKVRQALSYAINKGEIITAAYKSEEYANKAYSLFASNAMSYTDHVEKYEQDKDKSKKLLKEAGVSNLKLKLAYSTHKTQQEKTALVIQSNLKDVGVEVELKPMEKSAFYGELFDGKKASFDLAINGYVMGSEPAEYASLFISDGSDNMSGYANKEIDKKFKEALKETDNDKRDALYKEIQQILAKDAALYPISYPKSIIAVDKKYDTTKANLAPVFMFRDLNGIKVKN